MFAMIGEIKVDVVKSGITDLMINYSVRFAEHKVFKGKPKLQKIAPNLDELSLTIGFSTKSGDILSY